MARQKKQTTSNPMPQVAAPVVATKRPLDEIQKEYIREHYVKDKLTLEDLAKKMPDVDLNEIHQFLNTVYQPPKPDQPVQDRQTQMAGMPAAGQFMGRDPSRGVAVMTEAASEIADARRVVAVPSPTEMARKQPDRIHIIDPTKRVR